MSPVVGRVYDFALIDKRLSGAPFSPLLPNTRANVDSVSSSGLAHGSVESDTSKQMSAPPIRACIDIDIIDR